MRLLDFRASAVFTVLVALATTLGMAGVREDGRDFNSSVRTVRGTSQRLESADNTYHDYDHPEPTVAGLHLRVSMEALVAPIARVNVHAPPGQAVFSTGRWNPHPGVDFIPLPLVLASRPLPSFPVSPTSGRAPPAA